jgi:isochorismate pyruvate lyase
MDGADFQSLLGDLREELDVLDRRLVLLLKERADVIDRVIERKAASGLGPVDIKREQTMLDRIAAQAADVGLDPHLARQILRAVIEAFTEREARELG